MYAMIFHFDIFKVQMTSTQVSLSDQGCHASKCAELPDLLWTAHSSSYCFLQVNPSCQRASQPSGGTAARFCNAGSWDIPDVLILYPLC